MTETVQQMKTQAQSLSTAERADLAYFLLSSLEPADEGVEEAWRAEIGRRVAEIGADTAIGRPVNEVLAELRERYVCSIIGRSRRL